MDFFAIINAVIKLQPKCKN